MEVDVGEDVEGDGSSVEQDGEGDEEDSVAASALGVACDPLDPPEVEEVDEDDALNHSTITWITRKKIPIILQASPYPSNTLFCTKSNPMKAPTTRAYLMMKSP